MKRFKKPAATETSSSPRGETAPSRADDSREASVRLTALATLAGAALAATTASAVAAWHGYISHPLGFAFAAPGELKGEKGTHRGPGARPRDPHLYPLVR